MILTNAVLLDFNILNRISARFDWIEQVYLHGNGQNSKY